MVGIAAGKDLRFGFQPPKRPGVNDAVAIALEVVAVGMRRLGVAASPRVFHAHGIVGQHWVSVAVGKIAPMMMTKLRRSPARGRFTGQLHRAENAKKVSDNK